MNKRRPGGYNQPRILNVGPFSSAGASPFYQIDWPNPLRLVPGAIAPEHHSNIIVRIPVIFNQWTNPRGYTNTVAQIPFVQNVLTTTMSSPSVPFKQGDWQNPNGYVNTVYRIPFVQDVLTTSFAIPFNQTDWPVPKRRDVSSAESFSRDVVISLPFTPIEWVVPRGKVSLAYIVEPQNFTIRLPIPVVNPFVQKDWLNPVRIKDVFSTESFSRSAAPAVGNPFIQSHWSNPVLRKDVFNTESFSRSQATASGTPFVPLLWPNPTFVRQFKTPTAFRPDVADIPFNQTHWYFRPRSYIANQDWNYSVTATTLQIPNPKPFSQNEWLVPKGRLSQAHTSNPPNYTASIPASIVPVPNLHKLVLILDTGELGWLLFPS